MSTPDREWWASRDEEFYTSGPFRCREDAIDAGREDFDGEPFLIAEVTPNRLRLNAGRLLEDQYFEADDLFSYDHDSGADFTTRDTGAQEAAVAALQAHLDQWVKDHGHILYPPTLFAATHSTEHFGASYPEDDDERSDWE